jgi:hypothetical protein
MSELKITYQILLNIIKCYIVLTLKFLQKEHVLVLLQKKFTTSQLFRLNP